MARRLGRSVACALVALSTAAALPAASHADVPASLVAFGDSFSSGEGGGNYDLDGGSCNRSKGSWPMRLASAAGLRARSFACSGAKVDNVLQAGQFGLPRQLAELDAATGARIVTISIGGNDVGFKSVLVECALPIVRCDRSRRRHPTPADVAQTIARLQPRLNAVYDAIRRGAPDARLVVMGYPRLFPRNPRTSAGGISPPEQRYLNDAGARLDEAVRHAAQSAGATYVDVFDALDGHEVTTAHPWINSPHGLDVSSWLSFVSHLNGTFHPTAEGYAALARVAIRRLVPFAAPSSPPGADALARRFEPNMLLDRGNPLSLDRGEPWRPLDVDAFLAEGWSRVCHRRDGSDCATVAGAPDLQREGVSASGMVPFLEVDGLSGLGGASFVSRDRSCGLRDCAPERIYYHAVERAGLVYLDYWWYFRFNEADLTAWDHQSDWEGVVVAVDRAHPATFAWVGFAQHTGVWRYPRAELSCNAARTPGTCGDDAEHVNVFLANGTHAAYPTPCARRSGFAGICPEQDTFQGVHLAETDHDGLLPWAGNGKAADLAPLGPWAWWPGMWDPDAHVESPAAQRRFREPWRVTDAPCPPEGCARAAAPGR